MHQPHKCTSYYSPLRKRCYRYFSSACVPTNSYCCFFSSHLTHINLMTMFLIFYFLFRYLMQPISHPNNIFFSLPFVPLISIFYYDNVHMKKIQFTNFCLAAKKYLKIIFASLLSVDVIQFKFLLLFFFSVRIRRVIITTKSGIIILEK